MGSPPTVRGRPGALHVSERELTALIETAQWSGAGPPPLRPFGLVLRRDAAWRHEGHPILNRRLRERFDRSVVYLPSEQVYVVQIGHFRGMIEVEETGFFVRGLDAERAEIVLSDGSTERLDVESLSPSRIDGAYLCRIKRDLVGEGLPARFLHGAQADLLGTVEEQDGTPMLRLAGRLVALPAPLLVGIGTGSK